MDVIQYKCPNCGGELKFDPATGGYSCEWCKSKFTQADIDKQTQSKKEQAGGSTGPASSAEKTKATEDEAGKVYTCPSCGATIVTDGTTAATFCYYCHNPVVLSGRLEGDFKPDLIVPFAIDKKKALEIFESWIRKKKYVPKAFYSKNQIEKFTGVYFPYYVYSCNIDGQIDANATKVNVYQSAGVEYTERDTYHVVRKGNMEVAKVMRNALGKANKVLSECVLPYEPEGFKPFNMSYLSGFMAEKRDLEKSQFEQEVQTEVHDFAINQLQMDAGDYQDLRITSDNIRLENEKWEYALLPAWTLTYNDNGKIYYFSINGQTGRTVGELPVDKKKLIITFLCIFIPFALLLLAFFYFIF